MLADRVVRVHGFLPTRDGGASLAWRPEAPAAGQSSLGGCTLISVANSSPCLNGSTCARNRLPRPKGGRVIPCDIRREGG